MILKDIDATPPLTIADDRPGVLIVDDIDDNLLALEGMLRRDDATILTARSGREALELLLGREVAVAIIDVQMPEMDGFELAALMRGVERTRNVPIILVTAGSRQEYRVVTGYESGAIDFLFKPINASVLRGKVDVLITLEKQRRQLRSALQDAQRNQLETELLFKLAQAANRSEKPEDVYGPSLDTVQALFGAERSSILLWDDQRTMRFKAWRGLSDAYRAAVDGHSPWSQSETDPQPILIGDVQTEPSMEPYRSVFASEGIRAIGFIPLVSQRRLLGKFMMYWSGRRTFLPRDRNLAMTIASQIAQSIDRAQLFESERKARRDAEAAKLRLSALQMVSEGALAHLEIDPLLNETVTRIRKIFACDTATVLQLSEDRKWLKVRACSGIESEAWEKVAVPFGVALAGRVAAERSPVIVEDLSKVEVYSPVLKERVRSLAAVPLILNHQVLGVLHIGFKHLRSIDGQELELLETVAARVTSALDRAAAYESLRRAEEKLHIALGAGRMGVWEWDLAAGRVTWSPTLEAIHGLAAGAFSGTFEAYQSDIHPDDKQRVLETVQTALREKRNLELSYRIVRPDGQVRWLASHGTVMADAHGRVMGMTGICMDITDRKELEQIREAAISELERNVKFNDLFNGILGHDLRTPLTSIRMSAELVLRRGADEKVCKSLRQIMASADRMGGMIHQILDFTRVRLGSGIPIERKPADMEAVARRISGELEHTNPNCSLRIQSKGDTNGSWDADRLAQVFSNLLSNAMQYGVATDGVDVKIDGTNSDWVQVEVHNQGVIPADVVPRLFEPLAGAKENGHRSTGLGLGLFITREIIVSHGGTITAASTEPRGTVFSFRLPRTGN